MTVKFSKHAVQRLNERFANTAAHLVQIIEAGLFRGWASPLPNSRWSVDGMIGHRRVRIVVTDIRRGVITVVTAYWVA